MVRDRETLHKTNNSAKNPPDIMKEQDQQLTIGAGSATNIHKVTVIVNGCGISEKDFDDQMIGSDLKAKVAVPHSRLFAFDKSTNSQVDVDDLDLITNRYGDNLRLVESNSGNVREIFPTFLVL